jgi:hypothetical protein
MLLKSTLAMILTCYFASCANATTTVPPTRSLIWKELTLVADAPDPFYEVVLEMHLQPNGQISSLEVRVAGERVALPESVFADLRVASEISIAYADPKQTESGTVEYLELIFEVGDAYVVDWGDEYEGETRYTSMRDIASIRIDANRQVTRKINSMRNFGRRET